MKVIAIVRKNGANKFSLDSCPIDENTLGRVVLDFPSSFFLGLPSYTDRSTRADQSNIELKFVPPGNSIEGYDVLFALEQKQYLFDDVSLPFLLLFLLYFYFGNCLG